MYRLKTNKGFKKTLNLLILTFLSVSLFAQQKQFQAVGIGFYNEENLFDTIRSAGFVDGTKDYQDQFYHISISQDSISKYAKDTVNCKCSLTEKNIRGKKIIRSLILQNEFSPQGPKAWNTEKYNQKLKNLSKVISELGSSITKTAPVAVGFAEVESRGVLEDLINQPSLKPYDYGIVHYNSWDKRGIDVGFIYQKSRFKVIETKKYELKVFNDNGTRDYTRDIVRITGLLDGEEISFIINHWPSRRGGEAASYPRRKAAGELLKSIFDEMVAKNPKAKVIAMGDMNDDPTDRSIIEALGAKGDIKKVKTGDIYNAMYPLYKKGQGTLAYRDSWNLFDQMFFSKGLLGKDFKTYEMYKTEIYAPSYLISQEGAYKGFPHRMYAGDTYRYNGYSDHFPVFTVLLREVSK
ncbi:endonuclease [Ornithobacterium rhinotracheale]|uniref:endonuclease/exonuclease/phosphatase family protein n=1 Tax=Ornithobacterium rhinotracheale TaxID=28251 RepID=UPI00129C1CD4|nr:endonuclease [Ornithobacterium rhinotracheale]MRI63701.1 endonuclease [Ornithobacterium rhinotracheale]